MSRRKDQFSHSPFSPQVKICGLTRVDDAVACAELGADAIGLIFYPPSPRFVDDATARQISSSLPERVWPVGVFVDVAAPEVMNRDPSPACMRAAAMSARLVWQREGVPSGLLGQPRTMMTSCDTATQASAAGLGS